eukprot:jgi/Tetstr1/446791/TSEL_034272.t1
MYEVSSRGNTRPCNKYGTQSSSNLPGIMVHWCLHCKNCVMFGVMDSAEGPGSAFEHFHCFYPKMPDAISYDNGCNLHRYALNREPWLWKFVQKLIDEFHAKNHVDCSCNYNSAEHKTKAGNFSLCEQKFAPLAASANAFSHMDQVSFLLLMRFKLACMNLYQWERTRGGVALIQTDTRFGPHALQAQDDEWGLFSLSTMLEYDGASRKYVPLDRIPADGAQVFAPFCSEEPSNWYPATYVETPAQPLPEILMALFATLAPGGLQPPCVPGPYVLMAWEGPHRPAEDIQDTILSLLLDFTICRGGWYKQRSFGLPAGHPPPQANRVSDPTYQRSPQRQREEEPGRRLAGPEIEYHGYQGHMSVGLVDSLEAHIVNPPGCQFVEPAPTGVTGEKRSGVAGTGAGIGSGGSGAGAGTMALQPHGSDGDTGASDGNNDNDRRGRGLGLGRGDASSAAAAGAGGVAGMDTSDGNDSGNGGNNDDLPMKVRLPHVFARPLKFRESTGAIHYDGTCVHCPLGPGERHPSQCLRDTQG